MQEHYQVHKVSKSFQASSTTVSPSSQIASILYTVSTVDETSIDDNASAADNAFNDPFTLVLWVLWSSEHMIVEVIAFGLDMILLHVSSGWKKLVEIVNDIVRGLIDQGFGLVWFGNDD